MIINLFNNSTYSRNTKNINFTATPKIDYNKYDFYYLRTLVEEGNSLSQIAEYYHTTTSRIRSVLNHFNLKTQEATLLDAINIDELKELHNSGFSQKSIAEHFGLEQAGSLSKLYKKIGLRNNIQNITAEELQKLVDEGYDTEQLAKMFNVSSVSISIKLRALGIKTSRCEVRDTPLSLEQVKYLYCDLKMAVTEIARKLGVSIPRINKIIKDNQIKTHADIINENLPTKDEMLKQITGCKTLKEYSQRLGLNPSKTESLMKQYGIQLRKVEAEDITIIKKLLKENPKLSVDEIAEKLNINGELLDAAFKTENIIIFHTNDLMNKDAHYTNKPYHIFKIAESCAAQGDSAIQIAEQLGISSEKLKHIISDYCKKHNISFEFCKNKVSPDEKKLIKTITSMASKKLDKDGLYKKPEKLKRNIIKKLKISEESFDYLIKKYNLNNLFISSILPESQEIEKAITDILASIKFGKITNDEYLKNGYKYSYNYFIYNICKQFNIDPSDYHKFSETDCIKEILINLEKEMCTIDDYILPGKAGIIDMIENATEKYNNFVKTTKNYIESSDDINKFLSDDYKSKYITKILCKELNCDTAVLDRALWHYDIKI